MKIILLLIESLFGIFTLLLSLIGILSFVNWSTEIILNRVTTDWPLINYWLTRRVDTIHNR